MANIITIPEGAIVEDIDLYIDKQTNLQMINVRQYDSGMRYIRASVWDNGDLYPMLTTDIICLTATKPDRNPLFNQAGIDSEGRIIYEMTEQTTSAYGVFIAEFRIYNTKQVDNQTVNTLKSTYDFKINVAKSNVQDTTIISTPEFNALTDAMASVGDLVADVSNAIENSNVATANAINATNNANTKATLANEKAILADEKATEANNAANLANEKAGLANTATSNANTATTNANTATANANTATTNANNAANLANEKAGLANTAATNANDVATQLSNETLKIYKGVVVSYSDLATTYPNPENGWTVTVSSESASYRYNGTEWINLGVISSVGTATDTTLGAVKGGGDVHIAIDGSISVPNKLEKTGDSKDNIITFEDYTTTTPIPSAEAALSEILSGKKHNSLWSNIKAFCNGVITVGKLANNLITTNEGLALDARQGKVLKDEIDVINNNLPNIGYTNEGIKNSIYRGKNLGSAVTAKQYADIANGSFTDLYIGDHWTINGINWRIAAFNYYRNTGDNLVPGNHITLVSDTTLYGHIMNDTNITTGGYIGSKMYTEGLEQAKTTIRGIFGTHLLKHRQILSNATADGRASGWAWIDSEVELMNEIMVYGSIVWGESTIGGSGYNIGVDKSQLPLFALNPRMINTRQNYWLRDVVSAAYFASVSHNGSASYSNASYALGVRPAFSIS